MQSNFSHDDLEQFLRQSADSCRMRPSEEVWKGVAKSLNEQKRRIRIATGALLMAASLLGFFLIDSAKNINSTLASASAEVNNSDARASDGPASHKTAPADQAFITPKQGQAPVRSITTALPLFRIEAEQTPSESAISNDVTAGAPVKELAPVVSLFKRDDLSSSLADKAASALPITINDEPSKNQEVTTTNSQDTKEERDLLSVESVANVFRALRNKNKFTFQVYFTPTVSYRKLSENKAYLRAAATNPNATPNLASFYSVNNAVTHKPDMGLELGFAAKYPVTKNISVRGGLQFNMNRYDIKAFNYTPEVATIALNTGNNQVDYLGSVTSYRNFGGNTTDWLQNLYFQVSVPVGVEVTLHSKKQTRFGIASTLQPTYLAGDRAYLISSDYKNYTEVPWLTRKWNVNTNLETFVSYSTGRMRWQVGPQVRYQLLSSFISKYPVKENLFDFGLKVGVSLNKSTDK
jgi:hypothetical protein